MMENSDIDDDFTLDGNDCTGIRRKRICARRKISWQYS